MKKLCIFFAMLFASLAFGQYSGTTAQMNALAAVSNPPRDNATFFNTDNGYTYQFAFISKTWVKQLSGLDTIIAGRGITVNIGSSHDTVSLTTPVTVANGGTGVATGTAHSVPIFEGTSALANTGAGTSGQVLTSNGASSDPTWQAAAGGGGSVIPNITPQTAKDYPPAYWLGNVGNIDAAHGDLPTHNIQYFIPFSVGVSSTCSRLSLDCVVAGAAGDSARCGIYNDNAGKPGTLIIDAGAKGVSSTGVIAITVSPTQTLTAGTLYWLSFLTNSTTAKYAGFIAEGVLSAQTIDWLPVLGNDIVNGPYDDRSGTQAWGALPANAPITTLNFLDPCPVIFVRP